MDANTEKYLREEIDLLLFSDPNIDAKQAFSSLSENKRDGAPAFTAKDVAEIVESMRKPADRAPPPSRVAIPKRDDFPEFGEEETMTIPFGEVETAVSAPIPKEQPVRVPGGPQFGTADANAKIDAAIQREEAVTAPVRASAPLARIEFPEKTGIHESAFGSGDYDDIFHKIADQVAERMTKNYTAEIDGKQFENIDLVRDIFSQMQNFCVRVTKYERFRGPDHSWYISAYVDLYDSAKNKLICNVSAEQVEFLYLKDAQGERYVFQKYAKEKARSRAISFGIKMFFPKWISEKAEESWAREHPELKKVKQDEAAQRKTENRRGR